jgi:hypothetical protein
MRLLWVLLMIAGVVFFGGLALTMGLVFFSGLEELPNIRRAILPLLSLMAAGACAAGIFMKPQEFKAAMEPEEEEAPAAEWIKEMRREQDSANDRDA